MSESPTKPHMTFSGTHATFTWNAATDAQTPSLGLSYNLRVGTTPFAGNIMSGQADPATGYRCPNLAAPAWNLN